MHIRQLLLICLALWPFGLAAQSTTPSKPDTIPAAATEKAPVPLNIDSLQRALIYPTAALNTRIEGKVIMRVKIDESGLYSEHLVLMTPNLLLTREAERMVQHVRYAPAMRDGRAINYVVSVSFEFKLPADTVDDGNDIGPADTLTLEKEPVPVNLPEVKKLIGYNPMAKEAEIEGKVVLRIKVNERGEYVKHIVLKDPHYLLTNSVTSKISQLRFTPGIQDGKPIAVWVTIPFDFKLMIPNLVLRSLEEVRACREPSRVVEVYLKGEGLNAFPMEILQFTQLTKLNLGSNQLTDIPWELKSLTKLQMLWLDGNQFSNPPAAVFVMPNLQYISLSKNPLDKRTKKSLEKFFGDKLIPRDIKWNVEW